MSDHPAAARPLVPAAPDRRHLAVALIAAFLAAMTVAVTSVNARDDQHISSRVVEAINLACATYGHCAELWSKARCETGGTFSPSAHNPSGASGLFQFMPSTFNSTPYGRMSIWSAYANAMAAGWMLAHGRGSEWACR